MKPIKEKLRESKCELEHESTIKREDKISEKQI
jgi:hypothetical protein